MIWMSVALAGSMATSKPTPVALGSGDEAKLLAGEAVLRQAQTSGDAGHAVAVQYVNAPAEIVWDVLLDYDAYPQRVDGCEQTDVYEKVGNDWYVWFEVSLPLGITSEYATKNSIHRDDGWMAWELDPRRDSPVNVNTGYWLVTELSPTLTRLDYATEMQIPGVPSFVVKYLAKGALSDGTAWVKTVSEQLAK